MADNMSFGASNRKTVSLCGLITLLWKDSARQVGGHPYTPLKFDLGGQPDFSLKVWMQLWGHRLDAYNVKDNALKYIWRHPSEDGQMNTSTRRVELIH